MRYDAVVNSLICSLHGVTKAVRRNKALITLGSCSPCYLFIASKEDIHVQKNSVPYARDYQKCISISPLFCVCLEL